MFLFGSGETREEKLKKMRQRRIELEKELKKRKEYDAETQRIYNIRRELRQHSKLGRAAKTISRAAGGLSFLKKEYMPRKRGKKRWYKKKQRKARLRVLPDREEWTV